jgi:multiple sugar transport system ATP-binding protein
MAFALKLRKTPKAQINEQVNEAATILDIMELMDRRPKALSGGQRQRVALGRAMVRNPAVFLLDEPLSNLDAKLRSTMRAELIKLQKRLETTFVYVTHDQAEAMTMGDRIVVMDKGFIQQVDSPQKLYDNPCNIFVAGFIGTPPMNFMRGIVSKSGNGYSVSVGDVSFPVPPDRLPDGVIAPYENKEVTVGIRPEDLHLDAEHSTKPTAGLLNAKVDIAEMMGSEILVTAVAGENSVIAKVSVRHTIRTGDELSLVVDCDKMHLFDNETGAVIR